MAHRKPTNTNAIPIAGLARIDRLWVSAPRILRVTADIVVVLALMGALIVADRVEQYFELQAAQEKIASLDSLCTQLASGFLDYIKRPSSFGGVAISLDSKSREDLIRHIDVARTALTREIGHPQH